MENYKGNSYKSREAKAQEERKPLEKVVKGPVKVKKKTGFQKFTESIIVEDLGKAKDYVFQDVLIPSLKKTISDITKNVIDILLYGETGRSSKNNSIPASRVSYGKFYDSPNSGLKPHSVRTAYDFDTFVFTTRGEAQTVLDALDETLDRYGIVSVADLYDLLGQTGSYTDNGYGWTDLHSASIVRVQEGFLLKLPRVQPIN